MSDGLVFEYKLLKHKGRNTEANTRRKSTLRKSGAYLSISLYLSTHLSLSWRHLKYLYFCTLLVYSLLCVAERAIIFVI